ncbi:MAG: hypothetical protein JWL76_2041 [Thermoleophilia bacterium]|nr:hypothetical protein [Thermoleophilia bacterium]
MFSLSPISPAGPSRLASPPVKGDDWCGTKPPGAGTIEMPRPGVPPMTTPDRNPLSRVLGHVTEGYLAMLEAHGALNPVQLMVVMPGQRPVAPNVPAAITNAKRGIDAIDAAVDSYGQRRDELATALSSAATAAREGYATLTAEHGTDLEISRPIVSQQFDAAATWLDVAGNLLALRLGKPGGFDPFAGN